MAYIYRTPASSGSNSIFTLSYWVKRAKLGVQQTLYSAGTANKGTFMFDVNDRVAVSDDGVTVIATSAQYRDVGAWYHIVLAYDTTESGTDKVKLYVNGEIITDYASDARSSASVLNYVNDTEPQYIGADTSNPFYGEMSHVQMVDGAQLAPTEFGEVDATSGIWKIKTAAYATPGTNGFYLKMEDRTNLDLDSSSNAFTWTTSGDLTPTYDNPSNNFCLPNALNTYWSGIDNSNFSNGNTTVNFDHGNEGFLDSTMGVAASKWYWEVEMDATSGTLASIQAYAGAGGVQPYSTSGTPGPLQNQEDGYAYFMSTGAIGNNSSETAGWGDTFSAGDVLGVALDLDNNKIYFARNGTWMNSGDPTSGATGTGAAYTLSATPTNGVYMPAFGKGSSASYTWTMKTNFGNGYLGTDTVGTTNQDSASIGYFKYAVPTGYYALCTKNIKAYGGV